MSRIFVFIFLLLAPTTLLQAQQDFEGRVRYSTINFRYSPAKTDSTTLLMNGTGYRLQWQVRLSNKQLAPVCIIVNTANDTMYTTTTTGKYLPARASLVKQVTAKEQQGTFTGDSMVLFGMTCYKYLMAKTADDPFNTSVAWYAPALVYTRGMALWGAPYFNEKGQVLLMREVYDRSGVCMARIIATDITPGPADTALFAVKEADIDHDAIKEMEELSRIAASMSSSSATGPFDIEMLLRKHTAKKKKLRKKK